MISKETIQGLGLVFLDSAHLWELDSRMPREKHTLMMRLTGRLLFQVLEITRPLQNSGNTTETFTVCLSLREEVLTMWFVWIQISHRVALANQSAPWLQNIENKTLSLSHLFMMDSYRLLLFKNGESILDLILWQLIKNRIENFKWDGWGIINAASEFLHETVKVVLNWSFCLLSRARGPGCDQTLNFFPRIRISVSSGTQPSEVMPCLLGHLKPNAFNLISFHLFLLSFQVSKVFSSSKGVSQA